MASKPLHNALIRTHHIVSKKKIRTLRSAADQFSVYVLINLGSPGVMYVEGSESGVGDWVDVVHDLRYKDYHLAVRPDRKANAISITSTHENAKKHVRGGSKGSKASVASVEEMQVDGLKPGMREVESVKEFGKIMEERGVWEWWRKGMGYEKAEGVI